MSVPTEVSATPPVSPERQMSRKSVECRRGVRAAITWLHAEALKMNDPHARAVLNNAAFHLGVDKPTFLSDGAPMRQDDLPAKPNGPNKHLPPETGELG